ncbi:MAG: helix-turn-helix transcriptional regulator [Prevotella sp.]|nr:helix-turn-helix transcriptional regulator [Prevotella sp.]
MMRNKLLEERRKKVKTEIRQQVALSFKIVDRVHDILQEKGLKQKDLALRLGKSEAEISKWMRGTHNFTIETISSMEAALGAPILEIYHPKGYPVPDLESTIAAEPLG